MHTWLGNSLRSHLNLYAAASGMIVY